MSETTYRLLIRQGVEKQLSRVIRQVEELVRETQPEKEGMKNSQFDNFLGVTRETGSVAVVQNWIRYQIGRKQRGTAWHVRGFGEDILSHLADWEHDARNVASVAYSTEELTPAQVETVWIELVRQYAGQLRRYYTYASD